MPMGIAIPETGLMIVLMGKEFICMLMVPPTKEIGKRTSKTGKEWRNGMITLSTKVAM